MADGMLRSPTFLVGAEKQKKNLEEGRTEPVKW